MVVLLVAHHVNHLVNWVVLVTKLGSTDVLCHIHRSAIATEQKFLVEPIAGEVCPNGAILTTIEESLFESFEHFLLAFQIGVRLVVYLFEGNAHHLVGLIKTCIHPFVHGLPQLTHFRVVVLPFHEHLVRFLDERCFLFSLLLCLLFSHAVCNILLGKFITFSLVVLVKQHIEVTNEVVAFLTSSLWRNTVAPL